MCVRLHLRVCVCVCVCVRVMIWESRKLSMTHVTCDWVRVCFQFSQKAYTPLSFRLFNEMKVKSSMFAHNYNSRKQKLTKTNNNRTNQRTNEQTNNARQILCDFWSFEKILRVVLMSINRTNKNLYTQTKSRIIYTSQNQHSNIAFSTHDVFMTIHFPMCDANYQFRDAFWLMDLVVEVALRTSHWINVGSKEKGNSNDGMMFEK